MAFAPATAARAHSFRGEAPLPREASKVKCTSCGCWAQRGAACYQCNASAPVEPKRSPFDRRPTGGGSQYVSIESHKFRDEAPEKAHAKIKCPHCGCWAPRGTRCTFCGAAAPEAAGKATQGLLRRSTGDASVSQGIANHKFRDEVKPQPSTRQKCTNCGCWVKKGGRCSLCRAQCP
eukprot:Hpha_TRINITY_DN11030_c0_g2::TRINITY_DN11030_c0_g2_i1::g.93086::m.93086